VRNTYRTHSESLRKHSAFAPTTRIDSEYTRHTTTQKWVRNALPECTQNPRNNLKSRARERECVCECEILSVNLESVQHAQNALRICTKPSETTLRIRAKPVQCQNALRIRAKHLECTQKQCEGLRSSAKTLKIPESTQKQLRIDIRARPSETVAKPSEPAQNPLGISTNTLGIHSESVQPTQRVVSVAATHTYTHRIGAKHKKSTQKPCEALRMRAKSSTSTWHPHKTLRMHSDFVRNTQNRFKTPASIHKCTENTCDTPRMHTEYTHHTQNPHATLRCKHTENAQKPHTHTHTLITASRNDAKTNLGEDGLQNTGGILTFQIARGKKPKRTQQRAL
jgi:hypothetical protein